MFLIPIFWMRILWFCGLNWLAQTPVFNKRKSELAILSHSRAVLSTPHCLLLVLYAMYLSLMKHKMISEFNNQIFQSLETGIFFFQGFEPDVYGNSPALCGYLMSCDGKDISIICAHFWPIRFRADWFGFGSIEAISTELGKERKAWGLLGSLA